MLLESSYLAIIVTYLLLWFALTLYSFVHNVDLADHTGPEYVVLIFSDFLNFTERHGENNLEYVLKSSNMVPRPIMG